MITSAKVMVVGFFGILTIASVVFSIILGIVAPLASKDPRFLLVLLITIPACFLGLTMLNYLGDKWGIL